MNDLPILERQMDASFEVLPDEPETVAERLAAMVRGGG